MNLNHFLNAIVTALSVATVLITLMSFLIFKIRQFPKNNGETSEKIEGTFFRKYDPFRISVETADGVKPVHVLEGRRLQITAIGFFAGVRIAIFTAIVVQNVISDRAETEKLIAAQAPAVEKYNAAKNTNLEIIATSSRPDLKFNPAPTQFQTTIPNSSAQEFAVAGGQPAASAAQNPKPPVAIAVAAGANPNLRQPASSSTEDHARSSSPHKKKKHRKKSKHTQKSEPEA